MRQVPAERLGELARHWLLGHRPDEGSRAAEWACRAGEHALSNVAPDQALVWFHEALARLGERSGGLRVDVLTGLGEAQRVVGDQGYRETLLTAGRLAAAAGDTVRLVRAAVANNRGGLQQRQGRRRAGRAPRGTTQAGRRKLLADEAVRGAREVGAPEVLGRVLALRFEATWAPRTHRQRLADTAELLDLAAASRDRCLDFLAARLRGLACWEAGRTVESDEHLEAECRIADEIGEPYLRWLAALSRASRLLASSNHREAEAAVEAARRLGTYAGEPDTMLACGAQLLHLRRQQGRAGELLPLLRAVGADYDLRPVTALIHAESGSPGEARLAAGELLDHPLPPPGSLLEAQSMCHLAEVAAALQDGTVAAWLYDRLGPSGGLFNVNQVVREGPVDHVLGLLAASTGDLGAAHRHFATAVEAAEEVPLPYWVAESRVAWARALLRFAGREETAHALLASADEAARCFGLAGTRRKAAAVSAGSPQ